MGWEESTWIATRDGRAALTIALTGMLQDNEIDQARANTIVRQVLRTNALTLYPAR